jgi:hypothetical protein
MVFSSNWLRREAVVYREVHGRDIQRSFAAEALLRDELPSPLDQQQLLARLIDLHRQVRNDMAEGGANTLFLAVGFLRWKKKPEDERSVACSSQSNADVAAAYRF